jgi:predicted MFS family arabinose efflux permease
MGAKIGAETALGGVFLLFAPALLIGPFGFKGVVFGVAGITLMCLPFLLFMPKHGSKGVSHSSGLSETTPTKSIDISGGEIKSLWFMLIAIVIFFTGETAIWSFLERIGNSSGFDPNIVGVVLAASLGAAMLGAFSEAAIGDRFGYSPLILFSVILFIIGTTVLYLAKNIPLYATGTMIVTYSVGFGVSSFMALVAYLDRGGRYIILAVPALGFGAIFGPGLAGFILDNIGAIGLLCLSVVSGVISYILVMRGISIGYTEVTNAKLKNANIQNS